MDEWMDGWIICFKNPFHLLEHCFSTLKHLSNVDEQNLNLTFYITINDCRNLFTVHTKVKLVQIFKSIPRDIKNILSIINCNVKIRCLKSSMRENF